MGSSLRGHLGCNPLPLLPPSEKGATDGPKEDRREGVEREEDGEGEQRRERRNVGQAEVCHQHARDHVGKGKTKT